MRSWYCIISGRTDYGWQKIISDKIEAEDKNAARKIVEENYCRPLPMRIRGADVSPDSMLLSIYEMKEGEYLYIHKMFEVIACEECGSKYRIIDTRNADMYNNGSFCSRKCEDSWRGKNFDPDNWNQSIPVIYRITEQSTGMVYIGKTVRSFTLRWWEHLKSGDDCKFHRRLRETSLTDWVFEVIEELDTKDTDTILAKETAWIMAHNSIECGYNSVVSKGR